MLQLIGELHLGLILVRQKDAILKRVGTSDLACVLVPANIAGIGGTAAPQLGMNPEAIYLLITTTYYH